MRYFPVFFHIVNLRHFLFIVREIHTVLHSKRLFFFYCSSRSSNAADGQQVHPAQNSGYSSKKTLKTSPCEKLPYSSPWNCLAADSIVSKERICGCTRSVLYENLRRKS
eukprot:GEMP01089072.1.p1 GENE.GEMP01089072.1~~GEMP01089072.1.p1  ORF type:complete len:109 (+),score=10.13 GEMP01089072.1:605-931(+)